MFSINFVVYITSFVKDADNNPAIPDPFFSWYRHAVIAHARMPYFREKCMTTKITIKDNGSIRVEGEFEILDPAGNRFDLAGRTSISLCRCGASNNKPFCDGSHKSCQFDSKVVAVALPPVQAKV